MENINADQLVSLHDVKPGQSVRVKKLDGQPALCHRLREMGFCELAEVQILRSGSAMLCQVCNSKVCLSRQLAESIMVQQATA